MRRFTDQRKVPNFASEVAYCCIYLFLGIKCYRIYISVTDSMWQDWPKLRKTTKLTF